jgi:hypothetical protein
MKQKDMVLIIVIVFASSILSFFVSNKFISSPKHDEKAAKVEAITADFKEPSSKYFNDQAINPTQLIQIQDQANQTPVR